MPEQNDPVRQALFDTLEKVKWEMPDGPAKSQVYKKLQEAILWFDAKNTFKGV